MPRGLIGIFDKFCFRVSAGKVVSEAAVGLPCLSWAAALCHSNSPCYNVSLQIIPSAPALPRVLCAGSISPPNSGTQPKAECCFQGRSTGGAAPGSGQGGGSTAGARMRVSISPWNPLGAGRGDPAQTAWQQIPLGAVKSEGSQDCCTEPWGAVAGAGWGKRRIPGEGCRCKEASPDCEVPRTSKLGFFCSYPGGMCLGRDQRGISCAGCGVRSGRAGAPSCQWDVPLGWP